MNFNLTQKERSLLEDQKKNEELCVQKYQSSANQTESPQLQQLFQALAAHEQQHLNTVNQLLNGVIPQQSGNQQSGNQQGATQQSGNQQQQTQQAGSGKNQMDAYLCNDLLATEKYVSNAYDTAIFEFTNPQVRQVLNHIQKEEQQHGEGIFQYMQSNGMYNPQ